MARMDGRRLRCLVEETLTADDEAPEQEAEKEERCVFGFRKPKAVPTGFRRYKCRYEKRRDPGPRLFRDGPGITSPA